MWTGSCSVSSRASAVPAPWDTTPSASSSSVSSRHASVANLYPFNYSGKTDAKGFYVGRDKYGSNILVDFDQRDDDKTSANILILGNSGQGKTYLMKLLILNLLEAGKVRYLAGCGA